MTAQTKQAAWEILGNYGSVTVVAATAANLALVADTTIDRGGKVPANAANTSVVNFKGIARTAIAAGKSGPVAIAVGDIAVGTANGAIVKGDTVFVTSTDAGKEGMLKKFTSFGADGAVFIVGVAETAADDGEQFEVRLQGLYVRAA